MIYRRRRRAFQTAELVEAAKRQGAAGRSRRRVLQSMAKAAGIDLAALDALHRKEFDLALRRAKRQEAAARAILKQERVLQRRALQTINRHRERFEYKKGNPHTSICLWTAITPPNLTVNPQTFNDGVVKTIIPAQALGVVAGQNSVIFTIEADANRQHGFLLNPVAAVDIFSNQVFQTVVPHAGSLSVVGTFVPQGTVLLAAPGDCVFAGSAGVEVDIFFTVEIKTAAGHTIDLPQSTKKIVDQEAVATCDGVLRTIPVGPNNGLAYQLAANNLIAVHTGDTVTVTAGIEVYIAGSLGGIARATFSPRPSGLNVPMVLVKIDG